MWLITTTGFFSVVQKSGDTDLTIRSRVRADLEQLKERYLPGMGEIRDREGTDYRFRASVSHEELAAVVSKMVADINYANFKDEVKRVQGAQRASVYSDVWSDLYRLQD